MSGVAHSTNCGWMWDSLFRLSLYTDAAAVTAVLLLDIDRQQIKSKPPQTKQALLCVHFSLVEANQCLLGDHLCSLHHCLLAVRRGEDSEKSHAQKDYQTIPALSLERTLCFSSTEVEGFQTYTLRCEKR